MSTRQLKLIENKLSRTEPDTIVQKSTMKSGEIPSVVIEIGQLETELQL